MFFFCWRTSGWERYLPEGYLDSPMDGESNVVQALNDVFGVIWSRWTRTRPNPMNCW